MDKENFTLSSSNVSKYLNENVSADQLEEHFLQLSKMGAFRQHVAYNLRCITHILENSKYDHKNIVKMVIQFSGHSIMSDCLRMWFDSDR